MDQTTDLGNWKRLLDSLESSNSRNILQIIAELANLFEHLSTETAPRVRREYESCTIRSDQLLGQLFDSIDLSDKPLLCSFLGMLRSFGYFRIAQITYHIEGPRDELDLDPNYFPNIEKAKWYDLCPLLPQAGTIGWKDIMNHGLVKEERELLQVCLQLLSQKLHFYSIISLMERFQDSSPTIKRNGEKVAEKLFELIKDVAYDDECMIGIDESLFNLLSPFIDEEQQATIIEAMVEDLFKPFLLQQNFKDEEMSKMYQLIDSCIMNKIYLQDLLIARLLDHLRCNIIRRKRRHNIESTLENGNITLESLLKYISNGDKLVDLLPKMEDIELSAKSLQSGYVSYWIKVVDRILPYGTLSANSSLKILGTCSIILVTASNILSQDLIHNLSFLMAKTLENTGLGKLDKLFNFFNPLLLIELTKILSEKTQVISTFDSQIQRFYESYQDRYLRWNFMRGSRPDAEKLAQFVTFVCDKNMNKDTSHLLQFVFIHELAGCLESFKSKVSNKVLEVHLECARTCSKRLYKFIKRNLSSKIDLNRNGDDIETDDVDLNGSNECVVVEVKKGVVVDSLVCILRIAIERKDQEMLDSYSDLLIKLYGIVTSRIEKLVEITQVGASKAHSPLDSHLAKLLNLYLGHKDMIKAYLNYDLVEKISSLLIIDSCTQLNGMSDKVVKDNKKSVYTQIKTKLEALGERANDSNDVYPTIINKQYSSVVDQTIGSSGDIKREKSCCHSYWCQLRSLSEVSAIISSNCSLKTYRKLLDNTVQWLEQCDPLDHPRVLYFFLALETLILRHNQNANDNWQKFQSFKEKLPKISCSLIRISKSVELGPSIHTFTRPGAHKSNRAIQCCTYANCIKIYTLVFLRYPPRITNPLITDAMQICVSSNLIQYAKYSTRLHRFFIQLASSIAGMLKSICIGKKEEEILRSSLPIFLSVFSHLIRCLILASDRQKLEVLPRAQMNGHSNDNDDTLIDDDIDLTVICKNYENQLELLALDVGRTLNNLSFLRVKLVDYAPHLISTYVKDIQRASCPDFVRLHLNEGIFRIFNLVDAHQRERQESVIEAGVQRKTVAGRASGSLFEMIHARLDQASREIFRDMHDNYNRFHRYLGKC